MARSFLVIISTVRNFVAKLDARKYRQNCADGNWSVHKTLLAFVACGVLDVALACVHGDLRKLADKARADLFAVPEVRDDELVGRFARFFPLLDQSKRVEVEVFGAGGAGAVSHARH